MLFGGASWIGPRLSFSPSSLWQFWFWWSLGGADALIDRVQRPFSVGVRDIFSVINLAASRAISPKTLVFCGPLRWIWRDINGLLAVCGKSAKCVGGHGSPSPVLTS